MVPEEYLMVRRTALERASRIISWLECDGELSDDDAEALPALAEELKLAVQCSTVD